MRKEIINIYKDVEALAEGFTSLVRAELKTKDVLNISLSGGSTPKAIFDYWASDCPYDIDWERIVFFWGDERCVPPDDEMSNFGMTKNLLFDRVNSIDSKKIHRIHGENDPQEEVEWYSEIMNKYLPMVSSIPCFDIFMLGMGEDGHTVSIFPDNIDLWDIQNNCVQATHPETGLPRISMTGKVVNNARKVVFLVTGNNKADKVKQIIQHRSEYVNKYPAAKVNPTDGELYWLLDEESAKLL